MDFTAICDPRWRLVAKEYLLARMLPGHELVAVLPHAYRIPLALRSCKRRLAELTGWLNWLTASGVGSLSQVSQRALRPLPAPPSRAPGPQRGGARQPR